MTQPANTAFFTKRPTFMAWVAIAFAVILLTILGGWQVKRLFWKEALITQIAEANNAAPLTALPNDNVEALRFRTIEICGQMAATTQFHIAARYHNSKLGYHVFSPFTVSNDTNEQIVLLNRGWVKTDDKAKITNMEYLAPESPECITGMVRTRDDRNPFTPPNQPDDNIWFGRDVADMAAYAQLANVVPISVDLLKAPHIEAQETPFPIPVTGEIKLMNNHLGYAITWFGLALVAAVIFVLYHRKSQ